MPKPWLRQLQLASHHTWQGSIPGQFKWNLQGTKWHWGRFSLSTLVSPGHTFHRWALPIKSSINDATQAKQLTH